MRAIIWKEFRETVWWALLLALVFTAAQLYPLFFANFYQYQVSAYQGFGMLGSTYLLVTLFGAAGIGLILGFLQILPERTTDRWATLLHRPTLPETVLLGKMVAGLGAYLLAVLPSFFLVLYTMLTPGYTAYPSVPEMALASAANLLGGIPYYLAALAVGLAGRISVVQRLLPMAAAMLGSSWIVGIRFFSTAVWATLFLAVLLGLVAWYALRQEQAPSRRPWLSRMGAVAVAFYAASAVGAFFSILIAMALPKATYVSQSYRILADGTQVKLTQKNNITTAIDRLDGTPYSTDKSKFGKMLEGTIGLRDVSQYIGDAHGWKRTLYYRGYRSTYTFIQELGTLQAPIPQQWFWIRGQRIVVAYDLPARRATASLTPTGFAPAEDAVSFPEDMKIEQVSDQLMLVTSPSYAALAAKGPRKMIVLSDDPAQPVYGAMSIYVSGSRGDYLVAVAYQDHLGVYDLKGSLLARLPYTQDVSRWGKLSLGVSANLERYYVGYEPSRFLSSAERRRMPTYVDEVSADGKTISAVERPRLPRRQRPTPASWYLHSAFESPVYFFGNLLYKKIGGDLGDKRLANQLRLALGRDWAWTRLNAILLLVASVLLAGAAWWLARRGGLDRKATWAWTLFVLVTNLPGFVAYWLLADWPTRVPCPSCGQLRRLDEPICPHCGAGWEPPSSTPTEIFDRTNRPNFTPATPTS